MVSINRILAWGYVLPAILIAGLAILLHVRSQQLHDCARRIDQAAAEARGAIEASNAVQVRMEALQAERDALDAAYDSLLNKYQSRPRYAIPPRPRTAPELRDAILRATRER